MKAQNEMTCEEWFTRREQWARRFNKAPRDIPAEVVWFLNPDQSFSERELARAHEIADELGLSEAPR